MDRLRKIIISSLTEKGVIGNSNKIPWQIKEELLHFRETTLNHPILMGRKTYDSIGRILDNRLNIIISKSLKINNNNIKSFGNIETALQFLSQTQHRKVFIIGGEQIFNQTINLADELILSFIKSDFEGDRFFPINEISKFIEIEKIEKEEFYIKRYIRK